MDLILNKRMPDEQIFYDVSDIDYFPIQEFGTYNRYQISFYSYEKQEYIEIRCFSFDEVEIPKEYPPLHLVR